MPFKKGESNPGFKKGESGNPGGRTKKINEYNEWIDAHAWDKAQACLLECLSCEDWRVRIAAVKEVNDRRLGKSPQAITDGDGNPVSFGVVIMPPEKP